MMSFELFMKSLQIKRFPSVKDLMQLIFSRRQRFSECFTKRFGKKKTEIEISD